MSYEEAMRLASRDEAFKATCLRHEYTADSSGDLTQEEFQQLFVEWVKKEESKKGLSKDVSRPEAAFA